MKIYRLEKMKKKDTENITKDKQESKSLAFDDILVELTEDLQKPNNESDDNESVSFVSTPSSYLSCKTNWEALSTGSKDLSLPARKIRHGLNELSKDQNLLYYATQHDDLPNVDKKQLKMELQETLSEIYESFKNKGKVNLTYVKRSYDNCQYKNGRLQLKPKGDLTMSRLLSQERLKVVIYTMDKIVKLLEHGTKLTKRELYYQLKGMVSNQRTTDGAIQVISSMLNVGMWSLNIVAQSGLVFGNLTILLSSGETINCNVPGTAIPIDVSEIIEVHSTAYFILVVEKEAVFHKLIEEDLPNKLTRPFILITGKGFPDLNTQLFLKKIWMTMSLPVFILVDGDPHGINIMLNYRFGSVSNAHVSEYLTVPRAKWLGVYPSEIATYSIPTQPLTMNEEMLVQRLLKTPYIESNSQIGDELKIMQEQKCKTSIEGLIKSETFLSEIYLPNKFFKHEFI